jgi:hypothetical protein
MLCSINFSRKLCRLKNNVERGYRAEQVADGNITWRKQNACWITYARDSNSEYAKLIDFPRQYWSGQVSTLLHLYVYCLPCCHLLYGSFGSRDSAVSIVTRQQSVPFGVRTQQKQDVFFFSKRTYCLCGPHSLLSKA